MRISRRLANFYFRLAGIPVHFTEKLYTPWVDGKSLMEHNNNGTLTVSMVEAAARKYRDLHDQGWSHGDASMSNVIYGDGHIRLIDFELVHNKDTSLSWRRANDLSVFLLDLIACSDQWLGLCLAFLIAYGETDLGLVSEQLKPPKGLARIWWWERTSWWRK